MSSASLHGRGDGHCEPRELALVGALLALLVLGFLWKPILRVRSEYLSTADVLNNYALTHVVDGHRAANSLASDPVVQFVPWILFAKSELAQGRIPLWNPYNGCGAPLLANYQSAVFSPFNLLFYLVRPKLALLASAFLKLWLLGAFTFLFLRRLELSTLPALAGAVAFMFCGHNAILLQWPHSGVIVWLPASLWCAETILRRFEVARGERRAVLDWPWYGALALVLAIQIYSGHPETLFFSVAALALWTAVRLVAIWWVLGRSARSTARCAGVGLQIVAIGLLALGLGAPQIFPFFEYLVHSAKLDARERGGIAPLDISLWPRYFFPNFVGTCLTDERLIAQLPRPNYNAATLAYPGALVLLLAALALPRALLDARWFAFALVALVWPLWAHDLFGAASWFTWIPWADTVPIPVSQGPWLFALAALAAWEIDALRKAEPSRRRALWTALLGSAAFAVFAVAAYSIAKAQIAATSPSHGARVAIRDHFLFIAVTFAVGLGAFALAACIRAPARRKQLLTLGTLGILAQTGGLFSAHITTTPNELFYPEADGVRALRSQIGTARFTTVGFHGLPPSANLVYGLDQTPFYDAVGISELFRVYAFLFRQVDNWKLATQASRRSLQLFGAEYLLFLRDFGARTDFEPKYSGDLRRLEQLPPIGPFDVYRVRETRGRYWLVDRGFAAADAEQAYAFAVGGDADLYDAVALGPDLPPTFELRQPEVPRGDSLPTGDGDLRVIEELPNRVRIRVDQMESRYLVLAMTCFPGWRASLDGNECALVRANYAFQAVDVPKGTHVVEVRYDPDSWRYGVWTAAASLAILLACIALARRGALAARKSAQ